MLGWEEWLALPELGLPAIKAKVDTGARTSALHAFAIETFGPANQPRVRFGVHPIPGRDDIAITCTADVVDRRDVTSSNGETESRYVIRTPVRMGDRTWAIEITLANREQLTYRMLLGRSAIGEDMIVDPASSFLQPRLFYKAYGARAITTPPLAALRLALMTRRPDNASARRLVRAAERRGHSVIIIDRSRLSLFIATEEPAIFIDGRPLEGINAVLVRSGRALGSFSLAAVRQLELLGAYAVNPADALARLGDPLGLRQLLARARIPVPEAAVSGAELLKSQAGARGREDHVLAEGESLLGGGPVRRFAIVAGRAVAAIERDAATSLDDAADWRTVLGTSEIAEAARRHAEGAAKVIGLGFASIDVAMAAAGPVVLGVDANVPVAQFERLSAAAIAEALMIHIEQEARRVARP